MPPSALTSSLWVDHAHNVPFAGKSVYPHRRYSDCENPTPPLAMPPTRGPAAETAPPGPIYAAQALALSVSAAREALRARGFEEPPALKDKQLNGAFDKVPANVRLALTARARLLPPSQGDASQQYCTSLVCHSSSGQEWALVEETAPAPWQPPPPRFSKSRSRPAPPPPPRSWRLRAFSAAGVQLGAWPLPDDNVICGVMAGSVIALGGKNGSVAIYDAASGVARGSVRRVEQAEFPSEVGASYELPPGACLALVRLLARCAWALFSRARLRR